ncbi:2-succinyl-6-hydroxy-2,4-cyclohexadiene-1-carboxylate synthase [Pseudanabaenaceae cyanobacterium LEGE 13415]|nr:2-succinyl-6-hydroxy-2,4-cyclohexadiene-1-carboxylate synthase [Pseudanabaenaceae cyanobacterium LEGE 13415]
MKNKLAFKLNNREDSTIVLFLHGFLGSGAEFDAIVNRLPFSCLTIDLPGHGETQFPDPYTMEKTAEAIVELLNELKINQANIVGYSMGGRLGLYLALNYPERFPKAVIESGSPGLQTEQERLERIERDRTLATRMETDFDQFLINWYNQPLFQSIKAHPKFDQMLRERSRNNPIEVARSLREMGTGMQPNLWEKLRSHQNPILLVVGEYDRKFVALNREMESICETAELLIVPDAGHNIHFEQPEAFVDRVHTFFYDLGR